MSPLSFLVSSFPQTRSLVATMVTGFCFSLFRSSNEISKRVTRVTYFFIRLSARLEISWFTESTRLSAKNFYVYLFACCILCCDARLTYVHVRIIHSDEFTTFSVTCTFATDVRTLSQRWKTWRTRKFSHRVAGGKLKIPLSSKIAKIRTSREIMKKIFFATIY